MIFEPQEIEAVLLKVVDLFLIPRFKELNMRASGEWEESLEVVAEQNKGVIRGRHYSEQLAKGREGGSLPPVEAIEKWVKVKFGLSGKEARQRAWAIAKKIEQSGTTHYQKGGTDLLEVLEEPRVILFLQEELGNIARVKIADQLRRNAKSILEK
ncbi:hypothetical protein PG614_02405 [Riemerella anatipestifer]|nr:hypothetical protein [Riemerella anatipestifer]MDY3532654.1 hypothetical protein [Riemerella anatipestifer]MDY3534792.1 hypothetical protein [Riemerella anatipestifer]